MHCSLNVPVGVCSFCSQNVLPRVPPAGEQSPHLLLRVSPQGNVNTLPATVALLNNGDGLQLREGIKTLDETLLLQKHRWTVAVINIIIVVIIFYDGCFSSGSVHALCLLPA